MRAEGGLVPDALGWDARSALLGWRFYGYDVEAVSHTLEGFVGEDGLCSLLRIFQEYRHLCIGIAFSHVCDVDASGGVGSLLQGDVWCRLVAFLMNQNVLRRYLVGERGGYLAVCRTAVCASTKRRNSARYARRRCRTSSTSTRNKEIIKTLYL